jgi:hypothetical protein
MRRQDVRDAYYEFSGKLSDIARQLSFAAIALIWLFRVDVKGKATLPTQLRAAAVLVITALAFDFLQYCYQTVAWGILNRLKESRGVGPDVEFHAPVWINVPALVLFSAKLVGVAVSYVLILMDVVQRL